MKIKLVFAAVKGPPFGGMPSVTSMLVNSSLFKVNNAFFVDTTPINRDYGPLKIFRILHSFRLFGRLIKAIFKHKAQVVYIMSPSFIGFYEKALMSLVCRALGRRTVIHLLGGGFQSFYERSFLDRFFIRFFLRRCNAIGTVSEYWKEYLTTIVPRDKVWLIPNPVESEKFYNEKTGGREENKAAILFAGHITNHKGIHDLLEAVHKYHDSFRNSKVVIIGDGDLLEECRNRVKEDQLVDIVSFLGYVSEEEKIRLFKKSDIFVLPSHVDALPVAVLEAMSAGMPVVATNVGGIPSMVHEGKTGFLVSPGDVETLARRILQLVENPEMRNEMGKRAREFVSDNYDVELVAHKLNELLHDVVFGKSAKDRTENSTQPKTKHGG